MCIKPGNFWSPAESIFPLGYSTIQISASSNRDKYLLFMNKNVNML